MNDKEILQSRLKTERPAVPEGFAQRQDALLGSLRRDPQPAVCRMPRLAIVLAVVIALAGTIAIAEVSGLKLLDFARRNATEQGLRSAEVLDGADDLIQDNVNYHATQTEYAEHIVKQAAYDGMNLYMLIESRPLREDVLLIGRKRNGFFPPLENEKMADFTGAEAVPTELVAEHAARTGKQMVYMDFMTGWSDGYVGWRGCINYKNKTLPDGSLLTLLTMDTSVNDKAEITGLVCQQSPLYYDKDIPQEQWLAEWREAMGDLECRIEKPGEIMMDTAYAVDQENVQRSEITCGIPQTEIKWRAEKTVNLDLTEEFGICITRVEMEGTLFATRVKIEHVKTDEETPHFSFTIMDTDYQRYPYSALFDSSIGGMRNGELGSSVYRTYLIPFESAPEQINLSVYQKGKEKTYTIQMTEE